MFTQDGLLNSNELLSMTKKLMELTVVRNFHHRRPHTRDRTRKAFNPKLYYLNFSATDQWWLNHYFNISPRFHHDALSK